MLKAAELSHVIFKDISSFYFTFLFYFEYRPQRKWVFKRLAC